MPVFGEVYYLDQPLSGGLIVFTPDPDKGQTGSVVSTYIRANGTFDFKDDKRPGLPTGYYLISVAPPPGGQGRFQFSQFPEKFRNPLESNLKWHVDAKQENSMEIKLRP